MQTSSPADKGRKASRPIARRLLVLLAFIACAVVVNAFLTFVFVPYGSKSELAWQDYSKEDVIDCAIVGTSTTMRSLDPAVLDKELGIHSFNLATPSQLLDESFVAVRTAYEEHGISRVILGLSHSQVLRSGKPNPCSPFMYERSRVVNPPMQLEGVTYLLFKCGAITQPSSLNMLCPWASSMVSKSLDDIVKNAQMKLDGTTLYEAASVNEPGIIYRGKGFGTNGSKLNYNGPKARSYFAQERRDDQGVDASRAGQIDPSRARVLDEICAYCKEHDIELLVVAPPLAAFNIIEYGNDYFTLGNELHDFIEARGGHYVDINLARPELCSMQEDYFADPEHTNFTGAKVFSEAVCELVSRVDRNEDVGSLFMTGEEYLRSIDYLSCVFVDAHSEEGGIHLSARGMAGTDVNLEYQFLAKEDGAWKVIRDWSGDKSFVYLPPNKERGQVNLRVNARVVGSTAEYDRYRELVALY